MTAHASGRVGSSKAATVWKREANCFELGSGSPLLLELKVNRLEACGG
eukprot:CAMPEP_0119393220 /NCGR_PEP_ID=MMETSP1334-20130426/124588_1 /TAXON_ID=127549 /ORGANISM="Calcidiscus leptoporus, Strain RCC1130" /LENGTH=47 /DNA_ID= /DNA_START= /DNA_END= /DNA_ORIENTATION=